MKCSKFFKNKKGVRMTRQNRRKTEVKIKEREKTISQKPIY